MLIAVLPFKNASDNSDLDYFAEGFSEDLITDLSKFGHLQVISHYSSGKCDDGSHPDHKASAILKADFVIRGSLRLANSAVRITIQLTNLATKTIVWAERYDQPLSSIFKVQDEIVNLIVSSIHNNIDKDILLASGRKPATTLEAYDLWLKGYSSLKRGTIEDDLQARNLFTQALQKDPGYARAYTGISLSYFNEWSCQLWDKWQETQDGAFENALKAVELDANDAVALAVLGRIYLYKGNFDLAEQCSRSSFNINSNNTDTLTMIAASLTFLGYADEAEKLYLKALKLNPLNLDRYNGIGLFIYFEMGDYNKALELSSKVSFHSAWVDISVFIGAAHFNIGKVDKAMELWCRFEENFKGKIAKGKPFTSADAATWIYYANPYKNGTKLSPFIDYVTKNLGNEISALIKNYHFKRSGELCEFSYEGKSVTLPEVKGFKDIATLINHPYTEIHCSQLMGTSLETTDDYFALDEKAKKQYRQKIQSLVSEIQEAEDYNDFVKVVKLKKEHDDIIEHLTKSLGKGGKNRKLNAPAEKIRSAITWRIRNAIKKIEQKHPELALHLSKSIRTGTFCSYSPQNNISWTVD